MTCSLAHPSSASLTSHGNLDIPVGSAPSLHFYFMCSCRVFYVTTPRIEFIFVPKGMVIVSKSRLWGKLVFYTFTKLNPGTPLVQEFVLFHIKKCVKKCLTYLRKTDQSKRFYGTYRSMEGYRMPTDL